MNMQQHILAALREQFARWQELLSSLSEAQISAPLVPSDWTVKDVMAHLHAWQQRSIERIHAALENREPEFPKWLGDADPDADANTNAVNAVLYEMHREQSWSIVRENWSEGFSHFMDLGEKISEPQFLDSSRYAWMEGQPLAAVYLASYDHHQEHLEKLLAWLDNHSVVSKTTADP
jgi:hypothetical protein